MFPTPLTRVRLRELILVAKKCYERSWCAGTAGNFSIKSQSTVWMSPSGWSKGELKASQFIPLNIYSGEILTYGLLRPSLETPVHLSIYRNIPRAKFVVHAHPPHALLTSLTRDFFTFSNHELVKIFTRGVHTDLIEIPIFPNPADTQLFQLNNFNSSQNFPVILSGHGIYAYGESANEALSYLEAVENLCLYL